MAQTTTKTATKGPSWADDEDPTTPDTTSILPGPTVTKNPDGTETHTSYRLRDSDSKKIKTTRIIKKTVVSHRVDPAVAARRSWAKFGAAARDPPGPQSDTTSVGEDIQLQPRQGFKGQEREDAAQGGAMTELERKKQELKNTTVKCRICNGEHFTARCPFKGTMAPEGEAGAGVEPAADPMAEVAAGGGAGGGGKMAGGKYVAPGKRGGGEGEKMGGKYERDDLATLRVTNVSEYAEEQELRDMFERWGRVTRVFLAKDRETGRAKGFAFVSFADRGDAAKACARMDGFGYNNLILRVEFAKKTT